MKIKHIDYIVVVIAGILLFLTMRPYITWELSGSYAQIIFMFPLAFLFWINCRFNLKNVLYVLVFAFILLLAAIIQNRNLMGIFSMLILAAIPFASKEFMVRTFDKYKTIYVVIIGVSIVVWSLVALGFDIPGKMLSPLNGLKSYNYINYPFLVIPNYVGIGLDTYFQSLRFCGVFDEPGVIGTVAGLMLYIDDFSLKDKRNIVVFISGLLSLSLFFYVLSVIYFIYFLFTKNIKIKYRILIMVSIVLLIIFSRQNVMTKYLIWDRLEYDKTQGVISGDNRASEQLKVYFNSIRGTSQYWWGIDDRNRLMDFSDSAGYRNAILANGAVVCVMYVLFFCFFAVKNIESFWYTLIFITLFLLTLYQRPGLFSVYYIYLFAMYIVMHGDQKKYKFS